MDFEAADAFNSGLRALAMRHRALAHELLAPLGLHPGQEFLLMELAARGPRIQAQLAGALACEPPSVTLMVTKLEARGYVQRAPHPSDRRATVVDLTPQGRELSEQVRTVWVELATRTLGATSATDARRAATLFTTLAEHLDNPTP